MEINKIYICPLCNKEYSNKDEVAKHLLKCWKQLNPHQKSKPAPHSDCITTREISEDISTFFKSLEG